MDILDLDNGGLKALIEEYKNNRKKTTFEEEYSDLQDLESLLADLDDLMCMGYHNMLGSFESIIKNLEDLKAYKSQMILREDDLNDIVGLDAGIAKPGTEKRHSRSSDKSQHSTDNSSDFILWRDNLDDVLPDASNKIYSKLLLEAGKFRWTLH